MIRTFFISVICVAAGLALRAQAPEREVMTLRDCMEYAISNSTKVRIQEAASGDAALSRRDAALALFTPQISAQTYAYYNFGRSIDPKTNTYFNTTSFHNNYGVSAGYDLFDGFKAVNNYKISRTGLLIAESQEKQVEADICLAVMEAYYNVVYYKRLSDVYEEQVQTAERSLVKAKRQEELGQKGHADVIEMEADLADRRYDLINTTNMYEREKMTLSDLMFWPLDEELVIDTSMPQWQEDPVSENSVVDFALEHNPAVVIASYEELNARRELSTAKWQTLPSVGLYAGWSTSYYTYQGSQTDPFSNQFRNNGGEYVEVSVSIPIFNRLSRHSAISRKRNALKKASAQLDQKRRDVESEVRRALQDRDGSAAAYAQAQRKAEVQSEAYALNLKKLEQGLISPLEFQKASDNFLKAQADEMNSLFQYLIKQAVVRYYNGTEYVNQ
ncbi:MAG: TolC family protein [Bacteroidales bacterium]|nr:TolC family protein [Bacteroidales bacterium]